MNEVIKDYYLQNGFPVKLLESKVRKLEEHKDILREFEMWVQNKEYCDANPVSVEGYTAKDLSQTYPMLNGDGAFMMLIALRENPQSAVKMLKDGMKIK